MISGYDSRRRFDNDSGYGRPPEQESYGGDYEDRPRHHGGRHQPEENRFEEGYRPSYGGPESFNDGPGRFGGGSGGYGGGFNEGPGRFGGPGYGGDETFGAERLNLDDGDEGRRHHGHHGHHGHGRRSPPRDDYY